MLEPTGPLPPEIYWRRRAFAGAALVVVLALLVWLIVSLSGGDDAPKSASSASSSVEASSSAEPSSSSPSSSADSSSDASTTSTSSDAPSVSAVPSGQPVPPGQCPDQSLAIKVAAAQPTFQLGKQPVFYIVITNISTTSCQRDLFSGQQVLVSTLDGQHRLWSNTDCYPSPPPQVRNLNAGEQAQFKVDWAGSTSQPGCAGERVPVQPGAYMAVAQLGALRSSPEPFNIAP